jgi:alkylation response protein AidB-like acyl-CoA dehydrogenase
VSDRWLMSPEWRKQEADAVEFGWTDDQLQIGQAAVEFARKELNADLAARDHEARFPQKAWIRCAEFGVQGLPIPVALGGQGADLVTTVHVLESLGYGCGDNGLLFALNAHLWSCAVPIWKFGDGAQRRRYLPSLCDGSMIGVQAVTEAGSGSDVFAISTTVEADGDDYILNGSKVFISNASVADVVTVLARTGGSGSSADLCVFIVELDRPGITVSQPFEKLGLRTVPLCEITFTDCPVPASCLLGGLGAGMAVFNTSIEWERSFILASALGTMRRQLEESVRHASGHSRFGQPIGKNQSVANRIVDMQVRLDAARLLQYRVAWLKDQGRHAPLESAIVKLFLSEAFVESSTAAFQTFGAQAYLAGTPQERDLRDSLACRIYSGTSDIQRVIIGRLLGL